jgi:peptidoglycan/LPS O-acetylase OafA/YrhL
MTKHEINYRPDIDGLRALAIMGVLIFHLNGNLLSGGFVGVDVFFVISGFLISSIIDRDLNMGNFSIARFYDRRIRRIVPALFAVICTVVLASWFILLPDNLSSMGKSVRYAAAAISNILFFKESGNYFNDSVNFMSEPLLHTWSLGVEEQFYLVFPLLLWVIYSKVKTTRNRLIPLFVLFAASLIASSWVVSVDPMKAFFLLPYRAWELLLGVLIALGNLPNLRERWNNCIGTIGMGMIVGSMVLFNHQTQFPGPSALIPSVGAGLLLWTGRQRSAWTCRLLSIKPCVCLGLISYSVYLWHWPLIVLTKYLTPFNWTIQIYVIAASLVLGYLSWRFVECPFRNPQLGSRTKVFVGWAISSSILLILSFLIVRSAGFIDRFPSEVKHYLAFKKNARHWANCATNLSKPENSKVFGNIGVTPTFALWGDSHAIAIFPGVEAVAKERGLSFKVYGYSGLPPVVGIAKQVNKDAQNRLNYSQAILDLLVADSSIKMVVLHARWSTYNMGKSEVGETFVKLYGHPNFTQSELDQFYASRIKYTVEKLVTGGKKVVLIYPIPELDCNIPDLLAKQALSGTPVVSSLPCDNFYQRQRFVLETLDSISKSEHVICIKPHEKMLHDGLVTVQADRQVFYKDSNHLSVAGALNLKSLLGEIFKNPSAH